MMSGELNILFNNACVAGPSSMPINEVPEEVCSMLMDVNVKGVVFRFKCAVARAAFVNSNPMGRIGRPDEVAAAVLVLASDDACYITGVSLPVEGGHLAR